MREGLLLTATTPAISAEPPRPSIDTALVKAIARAHRWKRMIESGRFGTPAELVASERINRSAASCG